MGELVALLTLAGLAVVVLAYRRKPDARRQTRFVLALALPLLIQLGLVALFGVPPGGGGERLLNHAPVMLAAINIVTAIVLLIRSKGHRRFVAGLAITLCPLTLYASLIATMSLSGVWL